RHPRGRDPTDRPGRARARPRAPVVHRRLAGRHHGARVSRRLGHRAPHEHARPPWRGGRAVKPLLTQLPKGARLYLPDEAARKRHVETRLFDVFRRWGYREIVTPTFEYADVLARGTDLGVQENMFKLVDRETGRLLALRADITPQIARIVATRLRDEPKPIRLAYVTNVFRYDEPQVSHYREFYQAGVELIGLEKPEAEVEVIAMAIEGLRALGLDRFQLDLGHPDFFRGLLEEIKTDTGRQQELQQALARKDVSTLERVVGEIAPPAHVGDALCALPTLFGHAGVLDQAAGYARNDRSSRALANLSEVYRVLAVMEAQGVAVALPGPDFFIIDFTREKTAALSLARRLRDGGASVARDIISRGLEESLAYARAQRARHVLVVGSPRTAADSLLALDLIGGGERTLPVRDVLERPERHFAQGEGDSHA